MTAPFGVTESLPIFDFDTGAGVDNHSAIGMYYAAPGGHVLVSTANPLPVTGGTADTDDDAVAIGQSTALAIDLNYFSNLDNAGVWERITGRTDDNTVTPGDASITGIGLGHVFDGTNWVRVFGGVDNAIAAASPQGMFVGGIVTDPLQVFLDGDVSLLHFDLNGRLLVNAEGVVDTDDDGIAIGQTTSLSLDLPYFSNLDNAGVWERITGRTDDNTVAPTDASPTSISLTQVFDGTNWIRLHGAVNNAPAPADPQGAFTMGLVRTSFDPFVAGDAAMPQMTVDGAVIGIPRTQEPFELLLSQAALAGGGTLFGSTVQQNSLFAGSLGRTLLHGFVNYAGAASSLTISVQISLDAAVTWITTDTFTVVSGSPTVIRGLSVALGNRVRIFLTNNDGAIGTGVTNIGFYLTHAN